MRIGEHELQALELKLAASHACAHDAASLHGLRILEGEAVLSIVLGRTNCEASGMVLSQLGEA